MTKVKLAIGLFITFVSGGFQAVSAQNQSAPIQPAPAPPIAAAPTSGLSALLAKNLERQNGDVSRARRQQAYAKLLEGQRYFWNVTRPRGKSGETSNLKLAKQAFQKAIELDPNLAEAYTSLAELIFSPVALSDLEEAILLARIAVKIQPENFGARRILARSYTVKSRFKTDALDASSAEKAIAEWKKVAQMDPRFAEAWAFLSELYDKTNKPQERIEALQKWLASANPVDTRYYRFIMGARQNLAPESASLKLGSALVKANRFGEAVEILSQSVADDPENAEAIDLLKQAVQSGGGASSASTLAALQQAVFANPDNLVLVELLAQIQSRAGKTAEASKSLQSSIDKLIGSNKNSAAALQISLGDINAEANRGDEAIAAYEAALKTQEISRDELATDDQREFAMLVFGKMIQTYKNAGRFNEAKTTIDRARALFGKFDLFADRQLISLLRENGRNQEALETLRALRSRLKDDYGLLRLEALILTEMGRVEEGVELIKPLIGKGKTLSAPSLAFDDFNNYIYISTLFNQSGRGKEAVISAQKAFTAADNDEKKQIAKLTLANAQQTAGDFKAAEEILRNLIKQSPNNPFALNNLGYFLLERDQKIEEALDLISRAVEIDPANSSFLDSLGWAYFKLGNLGKAELYLKEAINNNPTSAASYEHLGDVYQKQGRAALAKKAWQKAMNLASDWAVNNRVKDKLAKTLTN